MSRRRRFASATRPVNALFLFLTAPSAISWAYALLTALWMVRKVRVLSAARADAPVRPPRVSVVSPACNEEERVGGAVRSWLSQEGVEVEVVVVDDRSTDGTGAVVSAIAEADARVVCVTIDTLPTGWLGKVHALHRGAARATGEWLLFADADVELSPDAIARAVAYAEARELDLLTAYPEIASAGFWGDVAWSFVVATAGLARMWRTRDPKSDRAFAVGAFTLIRRSAFEATPGFPWLKLEVADDQGLAMLLKSHGYRCDLVNGRGLVRLTWYGSLRDMIDKSQKNWFAIIGRFSPARCFAVAALSIVVAMSPLAVCLPGVSPALLAVPLAGQAALVVASLVQARWVRRPMLAAAFAPVGLLLLAFMIARAGLVGRRIGGIRWRGVLYPSALLRGVQRFKM